MIFQRCCFSLLALLLGISSVLWTVPNAVAQEETITTEESLLRTMNEAKVFLDQFEVKQLDLLVDGYFDLKEKVGEMNRQYQRTEKVISRINVQGRLAMAVFLKDFIERVEENYEKAMVLQKNISDLSGRGGDADAVVAETTTTATIIEEPQYVPISDLKRRFETRKVLGESEEVLRSWVLKLIEEEVEAYKSNILATSEEEEDGEEEEEEDDEEEDVGDCVSLNDAVQRVHTAVTEYSHDGIGLIDHTQGGEIVHSMTSMSHEAPTQFSDLLGNVWWRKYIPQDWEDLLPQGWEDWNVAIPSMFYHSFKMEGSKVSPPEAVLQKKTLPGSCWPMEGNRGQFTIRLPYPVLVDLFSLDHVSSLIIPEGMRTSAPKRLKVIGYPPCESEDCASLGFDVNDPMEIGFIHYDIDGPTVQTFESVFAQAVNLASGQEVDDDGEEEEGGGFELDDSESEEEGGCSAAAGAAACSSPPVVAFSGITVRILENWGNPDYTCIYRFRLHGNPDNI